MFSFIRQVVFKVFIPENQISNIRQKIFGVLEDRRETLLSIRNHRANQGHPRLGAPPLYTAPQSRPTLPLGHRRAYSYGDTPIRHSQVYSAAVDYPLDSAEAQAIIAMYYQGPGLATPYHQGK